MLQKNQHRGNEQGNPRSVCVKLETQCCKIGVNSFLKNHLGTGTRSKVQQNVVPIPTHWFGYFTNPCKTNLGEFRGIAFIHVHLHSDFLLEKSRLHTLPRCSTLDPITRDFSIYVRLRVLVFLMLSKPTEVEMECLFGFSNRTYP